MAETLRGHERIDRRENLDRWSEQKGRSQPYWDAWRAILARPLPEELSLMVEESGRMTAMRQASPFAGVLDPKERWAIYDRFATERP